MVHCWYDSCPQANTHTSDPLYTLTAKTQKPFETFAACTDGAAVNGEMYNQSVPVGTVQVSGKVNP